MGMWLWGAVAVGVGYFFKNQSKHLLQLIQSQKEVIRDHFRDPLHGPGAPKPPIPSADCFLSFYYVFFASAGCVGVWGAGAHGTGMAVPGSCKTPMSIPPCSAQN